MSTDPDAVPPRPQAVGADRPRPVLTVSGAVGLTVGIVIGAGIFRTPALVASNAGSPAAALAAWALGGLVSLVGALVYAELATTYPHAGGDYHYLSRAFGPRVGFLFAWARLAVIQTGSIALLAFVFGDYASQILPLGAYSSPLFAALLVVVLTAVNIVGVRLGSRLQEVLTAVLILGVLGISVVGLSLTPAATAATAAPATTATAFGPMMVFVLLTYGGWNEAAYVSAELQHVERNMVRALAISLTIIGALYLVVNWAYLHALGLGGVAGASEVAADVMRLAFGTRGAVLISVLVALAALTSANTSVFTGARTAYAFGADVAQLGPLGRWNGRTGTPVNALLVQGLLVLAFVVLGTISSRGGFETIVGYTAPVFWVFFLLTGLAFFRLRIKEPAARRPFRVPLYPITPAIFCLTCAYLLHSSVDYARFLMTEDGGAGALVIGALLAAGAVFLLRPSLAHRTGADGS